jgi:hypothetical protein
MAPASTGGLGGYAETGTCSWGRAGPAYSLGRWNCLTRLSTRLTGLPGLAPLFVLKLEINSENPRPLPHPVISRGDFLMKLTATHEPPRDVGGLQRGALGG